MSIGPYEPFWISRQERNLFGALHGASVDRAMGMGALLIPPLLHEQHRSHRFLCEMASCLSELGISCLRFSFFGSSDSEGNGEELDFASMASDIECAARALRERSACESFFVIAFRSGALPLHAWLGEHRAPRVAVLWDPVLDGAAWLQELEKADLLKRRSMQEQWKLPGAMDQDDGHLMGYAVSERLKRELSGVSWAHAAGAPAIPLWAVLHAGQATRGLPAARTFALPIGAPDFGTSVLMDATLMLSVRMERVVQQLGAAALAEH